METSAGLGKPGSDVVWNLAGLEEGKTRNASLCQRLRRRGTTSIVYMSITDSEVAFRCASTNLAWLKPPMDLNEGSE